MVFACRKCARIVAFGDARAHRSRQEHRWERRMKAWGWRINSYKYCFGRITHYFCPECRKDEEWLVLDKKRYQTMHERFQKRPQERPVLQA